MTARVNTGALPPETVVSILSQFESAGYRKGSDDHVAKAIALLAAAARVYSGTEGQITGATRDL